MALGEDVKPTSLVVPPIPAEVEAEAGVHQHVPVVQPHNLFALVITSFVLDMMLVIVAVVTRHEQKEYVLDLFVFLPAQSVVQLRLQT